MLRTSFLYSTAWMSAVLWIAIGATANGWAQRGLKEIPKPDPVAERAAMKIDPAADVHLFASDPDLRKPIQVNFDSTGGLWIASSSVYPQIRPGEVANDKIIVLRDTDGDGISDRRTVFADGLLIPTGVLPDGPHAAYVVDSTRLLYLQDTDRDGRADEQEVVLSGFGTEDTHHLVHTLRFGPDGCLYFNQSIYIHSHVDTPYGSRHLDGGGIWRYHPSTRRLEVFCKGFVNPWGHVFDQFGESFATDGAYGEGVNYLFPDAVFVASPGAQRQLKGMNPGSPKHCGLEILSGTHVPPNWRGDFVTNDFRGHRVCRFKTEVSGSAYSGRQQPEIIASGHGAFRPIDAKMGPDGAIYLADWYNPIIQHGEVDFRDDRRDREHGRIWRVSFPGRELDLWPDFERQSIDGLLALLDDPALPVRQFARQALWKRGAEDPEALLVVAGQWYRRDRPKRTAEWLWLHEALNRSCLTGLASDSNARSIDELIALEQVQPQSRRPVVRSLWRNRHEGTTNDQRISIERWVLGQTTSPDPPLRLESVALAGRLSIEQHPQAIDAVVGSLKDDVDFPMDFAIWQSLRKLDGTAASDSGRPIKSALAVMNWDGRIDELTYAVTAIKTAAAAEIALALVESKPLDVDSIQRLGGAIAIAGDRKQLGRLLKVLVADDRAALTVQRLQPLLDRTARDKTIPADVAATFADLDLPIEQILGRADTARLVARVAQVWGVRSYDQLLVDSVNQAGANGRPELIEAIGAIDSDAAKQALQRLLVDQEPNIRLAAARSLVKSRPVDAIDPVVALVADSQTHEQASELVTELMKRKQTPRLLARAIGQRSWEKRQAESLLRRVRSSGGNEMIESAIRSAARLEDVAWKLTPALKADVLGRVANSGSPERGEAIYRREKLQCIQCHAIGKGGGVVGPNLISIGGSSQADYILEALLEPNAKLKEGFTTRTLLTDEGTIYNGIVLSETAQSVRLRLADGKEVELPSDSIVQKKTGKSLMPEGIVDPLTKQELVDLVTFLSAVGRLPNYTVSTEPIVRSYETLIRSPQALRALAVTSKDTVASNHPDLKWRPLTALVSGAVPVEELDRLRMHQDAPNSYLRFQIEMTSDGIAQVEVASVKFRAWLDSQPAPPEMLRSMQLTKGQHTVVLAIEPKSVTGPVVVRVGQDAK